MLAINNTTSKRINVKKLGLIAEKFARAYRKKDDNRKLKNISLALVGPSRIKSLNRQYRKIDQATDVLSFTAESEIVINLNETHRSEKYREMFLELGIDTSQAKSEAQKRRLSEYLFYFLFVHGLLHLAGYDDKTETGRRKMIKKGRDFLKKIGLGFEAALSK